MRALFFFTIGAALWAIVTTFGGRIEGHYFPVTRQVSILKADRVNAVQTRFWGELKRERQCEFESIEWRLGEIGSSARADLVFEEGAKVRGSGLEEFGPWVVQLTREQLLDRSFAVVRHRCHPFWVTETIFYP